jgi:alanine racemase
MTLSRRGFVAGVAAGALARPLRLEAAIPRAVTTPADRFDPWIEVEPEALRHNVAVVSRLTAGRPILAVVKNNAYGLGLAEVASALEPLPEIAGFAVVKTDAALRLRDAGVTKPVLLMGLFGDEDGAELVRSGVHLALTTDDAADRVARAQRAAGRPARTHAYLDTGMSRMGIPYHRALPWLEDLAKRGVVLAGTFMAFTEEPDFDPEQLRRFLDLAAAARERGVALGALHAASSNGVYHLPDAHLDLVRPGIALFGAYPSYPERERALGELRPAVRLRARVVRVERLRPGDSVSYGREYVAREPTWIATMPAGHTDGVPREAVKGQRVLIGDHLYPAIGAVSASHTIVEVGPEQTVRVGDVATLVGPDRPEIHPNAVAASTGRSVYDILMHLNPGHPKFVVP